MISFKNAVKLAVDKLKIRRARTLVSVLAASVLFGVVAFLLISSNVFLSSIFEFHKNFFDDGKIYIKVVYGGDEFEREIIAHKGKLSLIEGYIQSYGENQTSLTVEKHPVAASVSMLDVIEDGEMLDRFKLAEPIHAQAVPVFLPDRTAATLTGADIMNTGELRKKSTNFIYTAEDDEGAQLDFEIIGLLPTAGDNFNNKSDYYSKFSTFFALKFNQDTPIVRRSDIDKTQPYYKSYANQFGSDFSSNNALVSFNNYEDTRKFADKYLCTGTGMCDPAADESDGSYGFGVELATSQLAIADFKIVFNKFIFWLSVVLIVISTIILLGTFSRVFLDEQKTAAIFEAIGATRADIWRIYFIYTLILGIFVALFTQIIGYIGAFLFDLFESKAANEAILEVFKITSSEYQLMMFGAYLPALWLSAAAFSSVILSFLLSARHISSKNIIQKLKD